MFLLARRFATRFVDAFNAYSAAAAKVSPYAELQAPFPTRPEATELLAAVTDMERLHNEDGGQRPWGRELMKLDAYQALATRASPSVVPYVHTLADVQTVLVAQMMHAAFCDGHEGDRYLAEVDETEPRKAAEQDR